MKVLCNISQVYGIMRTVAQSRHPRFNAVPNPKKEDMPLYKIRHAISVGRKNGTRRIYVENHEKPQFNLRWKPYGTITYLHGTIEETPGVIDIVNATNPEEDEEQQALREGIVLVRKEDITRIHILSHGIVHMYEVTEDNKGKSHRKLHRCVESIVAITGPCELKFLYSDGSSVWKTYDDSGLTGTKIATDSPDNLIHLHTLPNVSYKDWKKKSELPV